MTKTEKIQNLVEQLFTDGRKDAIQDIVTDLEDTLEKAPAGQHEGLQAAIDLIVSNYY